MCYLTDSEVKKIQEFFEAMFQAKDIITINIYCDNGIVCEIVGNDKPFIQTFGSCIKHDINIE